MENKRRRKVRATVIVIAVIVFIISFIVLWLFTPFGYFGVRPQGEYQISVIIGETELTATMENNTSSWAFHKMLERGPKTVSMRDYGGMEKVGMLWKGLPSNNAQIRTEPGDIILYMGSSIVVYYEQNTWNFTKMGHIDNISHEELKELLGSGNVTITFKLPEITEAEESPARDDVDEECIVPKESEEAGTSSNEVNTEVSKEVGEGSMKLIINNTVLTADLEQNSSTKALLDILKQGDLTIDMRDYDNMEKVGMIGQTLPTNDESVTTEAGDIILYQGNAFVIYYAPNSWNFTRLGKIRDITAPELKQILGEGNVTVTLSIN